jgi:CRISPR-associated endonuclease Csn1
MRAIWGFDLGVASVGFAVLRWDGWDSPEGAGEILRLGVRVFPESREEKDLSPKNAARRGRRLARRQIRRRRWRRVALRRALAAAGLLPAADAWPPAGQDPYMLRSRGLSHPLLPHELGWALFHLLKRRGFLGSRKRPDQPNTAEAKKAAQEEAETEAKAKTLAEKLNGRPLAEYLAGIESTIAEPQRRRGVGQTRAMVEAELAALWAEQRKHYPAVLTDLFLERIDDIALVQRPTYFRRRTIGRCELEPGEERALKAEWLTQRFEMLQLVNALRLEGGNQRELDPAERAAAIEYLERQRKPTWAGLRKALEPLGFPKKERFTHERGKKETVRGNATEAALRAPLANSWDTLPEPTRETIRNAIGRAWHQIEYRPAHSGGIFEIRNAAEIALQRQELARRAETEWGFATEQAAALAKIDLPDGYGRHSLKAMRRLLPYLEKGEPYMTAIQSAGYALHESGAPVRKLPGPNPAELPRIADPFVKGRMEALLSGIRNPTVLRTLGELQKVVNTLLRVHGRPDLIRIETTRELKQSPEERRKTDSGQRAREQARAVARKELADLGKVADGREGEENVLRLLLWKEQGGRCPYSGQHIGCADALSPTATEIDHIFPVSRTFDDSQANKVLCFARENRDKGNQTPYEWLDGDAPRWAHLTGTLWREMREGGWPEAKLRRCLKANLEKAADEADEAAGFTNRQLVDTSFIARTARDYLGLLFGGGQEGLNRVQPVSGRAVAQLRRTWGIGLGRLLRGEAEHGPKARDDHRHHAVDALTVALTGPGSVHRLSRWWQVRETTRVRPDFLPPWPGFWAEAKAQVEAIVVSHRVQAKLTGPLHDELPLGLISNPHDGGREIFVIRKKVQAGQGGLSAGEIERIIDPAVRGAVQHAVTAAGGDLKRAFAGEIRLSTRGGGPGPIVRHVRVAGKNQDPEVYDRVHRDPRRKQFKTDQALHHIAIVRQGSRIVSLPALKRDCLGRARLGVPITPINGDGAQLVFALHRNDALVRTLADGVQEIVIVREFYRTGQMFLAPHWYAGEPMRSGSKKPEPLLAAGWRKVSIDPIGRISPAK